MQHVTLHVPSDMYVAIEVAPDLDTTYARQLFSRSRGEDSEETLTVYADLTSLNDDENLRINMVMKAMVLPFEQAPTIAGDAFFVCPAELAKAIRDNDIEFQKRIALRSAFLGWITDYSILNGMSGGEALLFVHEYVEDMVADTQDQTKDKIVSSLAESMGIDPSQIAVIHL